MTDETTKTVGVFVGRLCPIHSGHQKTIDQMIKDVGEENCLIVLGSVGQKATFRVLFSYFQRKKWVQEIYKNNVKIVGIPDFPGDNNSWFELLLDLVESVFVEGNVVPNIVFYGGSHKDVEIFHNKGYKTEIVDRSKVPVSATVIRDMMLRGMNVSDFLDERIHDDVVYKFGKIMEASELWETPEI